MKTAKEFRRAHFLQLLALHGKKAVQDRLDCSGPYIDQLAGTAKQTRNIGDAKARQIELLFNLPRGSLDLPPVGQCVPPDANLTGSATLQSDEEQLLRWFRAMPLEAKGELVGVAARLYYQAHTVGAHSTPRIPGALLIEEREHGGTVRTTSKNDTEPPGYGGSPKKVAR